MRKVIDKKACRAFASENISINSNNGLLYIPKIKYLARSTVRSIAGKKLLVISIFCVKDIRAGKTTPVYVLFQGVDDFLTLEYCEFGKSKWRKASTSSLGEDGHNFSSFCAFYSRTDEMKVIRFCQAKSDNGFSALSDLQIKIQNRRTADSDTKRRLTIAERMKPVEKKALPRGLKPWIIKDLFPAHIFYNYRKGKTIQNGYCTHCKKDVQITAPRHNKEGVCPSCGRTVTFHAVGRNAYVYDQLTTQVVQKVGDELVARICKASVAYRDFKNPTVRIWENARIFFSVSDGRCQTESFYYRYGAEEITHWRRGDRPKASKYYYCFEPDMCGHVYPNNLDKELKGTPWEYSQLKEFYLYDCLPMTIRPYMQTYIKGPALEYLIKLGLYQLSIEAVYGDQEDGRIYKSPLNLNGRNLQEVLGVDKKYIPAMREININARTLHLLQKFIDAGLTVDASFLDWCMTYKVYDVEDIIRCLKYGSAIKLSKYISDQSANLREQNRRHSIKDTFELYKDYVRFCEDLQYDLSDEFILYPRHIKDAHDRASDMFDKHKAKIYNEQIAAEYGNWVKQYQMSAAGLMIVAPKTAEEIVEEGQKLHHCVGGYVARVAKKECVILFLRSKEAPETPFYTIEVKNGEVAQIRGNRNCDPTPEVETYMKVWEHEKLLPMATLQQAA